MTWLDFIYPPICRHCDAKLKIHALLCADCQELLEFLPASPIGDCASFYTLSCFTSIGPIMSLVHAVNEPVVQKMLAALITTYYCQLDMPFPEIVVRGGDRELGSCVSKLLNVPIKKHQLTDRIVLVPTIYPLNQKWKRKLFHVFPKKLINLTVIR